MRYIIILLSCLLLTGCVSISKVQQHQELDLVGIEATSPNILNYGTAVSVRIGIMHEKYFSNPAGTNQMYAAPYRYSVNANIGTMSQTVTNSFSAGQ